MAVTVIGYWKKVLEVYFLQLPWEGFQPTLSVDDLYG